MKRLGYHTILYVYDIPNGVDLSIIYHSLGTRTIMVTPCPLFSSRYKAYLQYYIIYYTLCYVMLYYIIILYCFILDHFKLYHAAAAHNKLIFMKLK